MTRKAPTESLQIQLAAFGRAVLDLFFPPHCAGCGRIGTLFCPDCLACIEPIVPPVCRRCGHPHVGAGLCPACRSTPSNLDGIVSTAIFAGPLRDAIHRFKYQGEHGLAPVLGGRLAAAWPGSGLAADLIIPVPLHASRVKERGYNQSALLARVLAAQVGLRMDERVLVRHRATRHQVSLGPAERSRNVAGAFTCRRGVADQRVVLIDDVCTTGSTLEACAAALHAAGAASVWGFTLTRARWLPGQPAPDAAPDPLRQG